MGGSCKFSLKPIHWLWHSYSMTLAVDKCPAPSLPKMSMNRIPGELSSLILMVTDFWVWWVFFGWCFEKNISNYYWSPSDDIVLWYIPNCKKNGIISLLMENCVPTLIISLPNYIYILVIPTISWLERDPNFSQVISDSWRWLHPGESRSLW